MTAELVCAATDPAWLERRREGITATDIVTIAGLITWDSPWALYHRKLGLLPEVEQSDRMRLGSWLERDIALEWTRRNDHYSARIGGLYRSTVRLWQQATPDRVVYENWHGHADLVGVLECKTWDERQGKHEWGPDGSDIMPRKVKVQSIWQMDTLGVGTGHVAVVFLPSGEFRSYTIHGCGCVNDKTEEIRCEYRDEIEGLRDLGFGFWSRILRREPPDLDGLEVTTDALRYLHPAPADQVELEPVNLTYWFDGAQENFKTAEKVYEQAKQMVREAMGDAHEATVDGRVVFRRTIGKRAGYTVPPGETDILRRIGKDKD